MFNCIIRLLMHIFLLLMCQTIHAEEITHWTSRSFNMAEHGATQWNWPDSSKIAPFYPLGISKDGWFAHSSRSDGTEISLFNLDCKEGCLSDVPEQDKCGCLYNAMPEDLEKLELKPLVNPQKGTFPARILAEKYTIEIVYKEKAIYSIARIPGKKSEPEFPGTTIYLVSRNKGRKEIGLINHNHTGIVPGVRPAGWIKGRGSDWLVVMILSGVDYEGSGCPQSYSLLPLGVHLENGFSNKKGEYEK